MMVFFISGDELPGSEDSLGLLLLICQ